MWGNASLNHINPLKIFYKKCVRTITFSEHLAPSEPIFQYSKISYSKNFIAYVSIYTWKCTSFRVTTL